jgi:hypothetical protein
VQWGSVPYNSIRAREMDDRAVADVNGAGTAAPHHHLPEPPPPTRKDDAGNDLRRVCLALRARVDAFLARDGPDDRIRATQEQVRVAMGVTDDALRQYGCVSSLPPPPRHPADVVPRAAAC